MSREADPNMVECLIPAQIAQYLMYDPDGIHILHPDVPGMQITLPIDGTKPQITYAAGSDPDETQVSATDSITVRQDVGGPYPQYKRVTLDLMSDGTVRWHDVEHD